MKFEKDNGEANRLRLLGNQHYKATQFYDALVCYNKSLCQAAPGSPEFSLAFANRSAIYMELKEYEMCLENIKLAVDCGYPNDKFETLMKRQEKCLDLLEVIEYDPNDNPWNFFKLSHSVNAKIPFVVDAIELGESKKFGRHLFTNRALKAGDIIAIEAPFHKFIMNSARFSNCANCLKSEKLNLFPCCECSYTMFCSKECMTMGRRFHQFECQVIDIKKEDESSVFQMAHRIVFEALGVFGKISKLEKFLDEHSQLKTVFDFDLRKGDENQREKNLLVAVNSLQRNAIPEGMKPLMDQHVELMKSITKNPKEQKFLDGFMRKQMEIIITNTFGIVDRDEMEIGSGIFPLASLFNHSCAPNVIRINVENKLVFIVSRPIEKNQQLFVCYRSNFYGTDRQQRREELLASYRFKCTCEACSKNYPMTDDLPIFDESYSATPDTIISAVSAIEEFKSNCDYINRYTRKFPSFELCKLIQRNHSLLEAIAQPEYINPSIA